MKEEIRMNKEYVLFGKKVNATELLSAVLVVMAIGILLFVIIPQIGNIGVQRAANAAKQAEVQELQASLNALQSANPEQIDSDMKLVTTALPTSKDVIAVFSTISSLATSTNVQLRGFTLKVGNLYKKNVSNEETIQLDITSATGFPAIDVVITVTTLDERNLVTFSDGLYRNFPIARINTLSSQENESTIEISFYYRPYDLNQIENGGALTPYTIEYGEVLQQLRTP